MKSVTRILAFMCAALMLLALAACTNPDGGESTSDTIANNDPATTDELYLGYEKDDIPDTLKYDKNDPVSILYWSDAERIEFEVADDADDSDRIVSAIKARNQVTEERLNVTLDWNGHDGDVGERANFTKFVETQANAGTHYDIIAAYSRTAGMLSTRGFLLDINTVEDNHLNFQQNWWPSTLVDTCTIGKSLYFVSGDISTNTLHLMYGIYFNKGLLNDRQMENPQELALSKKWTISKLIEMTSDTYQDLNNNGQKDAGDFFGFGTVYFHCDAFYTGSNLRLVSQDDDKVLIISPDFSSEKTINLVDQLGRWLTTDSCITAGKYQESFVNGDGLFVLNRVYMADAQNSCGLNAVDWSYGIVPVPLYNEDQENYVTVMGNPFTLYAIGNGCSDPSRSTAVLEVLASEAYRRTTPAIFEVNMKLRYAKDNIDAQMFDIIRSTVSYDLGRIYSDDLLFMSEMPSNAAVAGTSWNTALQSKVNGLTIKINKIVSDLEKNANLAR